jgi:hypothetical protein
MQQAGELVPFTVLARVDQLSGLLFQVGQDDDFGLKLLYVLCGSGLVNHGFFKVLVVVGRHCLGGLPNVFRGTVDLKCLGQRLCAGLSALLQFFVFNAAFELVAATFERLVNGFRAGCQAALQGRQREPNRAFALAVQFIGPVHFVFDVVGDGFVQRCFSIREFVIGGDGAPVGEELGAVKAQHVFFDGPAHQVRNIHFVRAIAKLAVEPVRIQQRHEELKVFFLAVVRRGRHQQKVARDGAQQFAELKTLGFFDLVAEVVAPEISITC